YLEVVTGATTVDQFQKKLYQLSTATLDPTVLVNKLTEYQLRRAKYDRFIPKVLLQEAYAKDSLDLEQAKVCLYEICGI
nr:hypothetical protein [Caldilineaceae bacterium]